MNDEEFLDVRETSLEEFSMSRDKKIVLIEEIWDSTVEDNGCFELTDGQEQELDRRIQSSQQNPQAGRSWEDIQSEFFNSK